MIPSKVPSWCSILFFLTILLCIVIYILLLFGKPKCQKKIPNSGVLGLYHASDTKKNNYLNNFIIKASYSSCAVGNFKNDYVDLCALKSVIKQGCRVLDFEVYSLNGDPIVAVSKTSSFNEKGSYNSLDLSKVLTYVRDHAISMEPSTLSCPNPQDPLILNFRMKTTLVDVYNKMAYLIRDKFSTVLLSNEYNLNNSISSSNTYENNVWTLLTLQEAMGKVIIMVDEVDSIVKSSRLYEIVNVVSNGIYTNMIHTNEVNYTMENGKTPTNEYYSSSNYTKMTMVLPPLQHRPMNYDASKCFNLGIQICYMCFQVENEVLKDYNQTFKDEGSAFILKNKFNPDVKLYETTDTTAIPKEENLSITQTTDLGRFLPSILTEF